MSVVCRVCNNEVARSHYSTRLEMCHDCREDELVAQMASMSATFTAWAEAFNEWVRLGDEVRKQHEAENAALMPMIMAMREGLGIDDTDPRTEDA